MRLPRPIRLLAAPAAFLLGSCLDDGPNRAGAGYLRNEGVRLTVPLHHFRFDRFRLDGLDGIETPLNHFAESLLVAGREGPFRATARLGFRLEDTLKLDSVARGLHLRLGALHRGIEGYPFLQSSTAGRDSLSLLVESFAWPDTSGLLFNDSLSAFHRRILASPAPFSTLDPAFRVRDTARVSPAAAYRDSLRDSLQYAGLPNLRNRLLTDSTRKWIVYLEISPLPGAADSGLFRFDGGSYSGSFTSLVLGSFTPGDSNVSTILPPYPTSVYFPASNYQVFHSGPSQTLLYGVSRGLHLRISRQVLLDSIAGRLGGSSYFPDLYDTRFFVPYAEIRLPLADSLSKVDGPFALDMKLNTDLDSAAAAGQSLSDTLRVALDSTVMLLYSYTVADAGQTAPTDSLYCAYRRHPADSSLRRAVFSWRGDSAVADTFTLFPDGRSWELGLRRPGAESRNRSVSVRPDSGSLSLLVFYSVNSLTEPNGFLDSAGQPLAASGDLRARYFRPGASQLAVRATRGIRALLNRNSDAPCPFPCGDAEPDLFLTPSDRRAFDTSDYASIPYPVLGEIGFPKSGGLLEATIDVFLYPLRNAP